MAQTVVQINFTISVSGTEYTQAVAPLAETIADTPGLQWKVWLLNESERTAGGVYLFADEASAQSYLDSALIAQVKAAPILSDFRVAQSSIVDNLTAITHGPLAAGVVQA